MREGNQVTTTFNDLTAINFTSCTPEELEFVLSLRNSNEVRQWMFTQHEISLDEHLAFVELLKKRRDMLFFLVKDESGFVGVIYFTGIDFDKKESFIGLYANHKNPQKQKGVKLINLIFQIAKERLHLKMLFLEVFMRNARAIKLYHDVGFIEVDKGLDNSETMLLKREV